MNGSSGGQINLINLQDNLPDEASPGDWLSLRSQADLNSPINDSSLCSLSKWFLNMFSDDEQTMSLSSLFHVLMTLSLKESLTHGVRLFERSLSVIYSRLGLLGCRWLQTSWNCDYFRLQVHGIIAFTVLALLCVLYSLLLPVTRNTAASTTAATVQVI